MRVGSRGFTIMELMVVLALVGLLAAIVAPLATTAIHRAKESALKENLTLLRKAIDDYYADHGRYPERLANLVDKRYIRKIPVDPITERNDGWIEVPYGGVGGGVFDIRSGAPGQSRNGEAFGQW